MKAFQVSYPAFESEGLSLSNPSKEGQLGDSGSDPKEGSKEGSLAPRDRQELT
jgi:hypothetical protein